MNTAQDNNYVQAKIGVLCTDGITLINIAIDTVTGGMQIDTTSTIGFTPGSIDFRNQNYRPCWLATNSVDGTTIPIFVNSAGAILVDMI